MAHNYSLAQPKIPPDKEQYEWCETYPPVALHKRDPRYWKVGLGSKAVKPQVSGHDVKAILFEGRLYPCQFIKGRYWYAPLHLTSVLARHVKNFQIK
jgi:hypothetical protein